MQFDKDIQSEHKDLFLKVRNLLLSKEGIIETKKDRITTYSIHKKGLCHVRTMPYGVDIGFLKGVQLSDYLELLIGKGKTIRVLPLKAYNEVIVNHFVNEAIKLNLIHKVIQF
jgi:hypothetical protein